MNEPLKAFASFSLFPCISKTPYAQPNAEVPGEKTVKSAAVLKNVLATLIQAKDYYKLYLNCKNCNRFAAFARL